MLNEDKPDAIDELKDQIAAAAAKVVIDQMTPDMVRRVTHDLLQTKLNELMGRSYSTVGRAIETAVEKQALEYIKSDQVQGAIKIAVHNGVNAVIHNLPEQVKGKVMDVALAGMCDALTKGRNRY